MDYEIYSDYHFWLGTFMFGGKELGWGWENFNGDCGWLYYMEIMAPC